MSRTLLSYEHDVARFVRDFGDRIVRYDWIDQGWRPASILLRPNNKPVSYRSMIGLVTYRIK